MLHISRFTVMSTYLNLWWVDYLLSQTFSSQWGFIVVCCELRPLVNQKHAWAVGLNAIQEQNISETNIRWFYLFVNSYNKSLLSIEMCIFCIVWMLYINKIIHSHYDSNIQLEGLWRTNYYKYQYWWLKKKKKKKTIKKNNIHNKS